MLLIQCTLLSIAENANVKITLCPVIKKKDDIVITIPNNVELFVSNFVLVFAVTTAGFLKKHN